MSLDVLHCRHPYCIGVGGIGVSAIAQYFLATGRPIAGTTLMPSRVTDGLISRGAVVTFGTPEPLPAGTDLVIYSDAVPANHPQRREAQARKILTLNYARALAQITSTATRRIVVTGTNGKTTTTAMLAWILSRAGLDPTAVVGSLVPQIGGNFRLGNGSLSVCEGDEYLGHVLELNPTHIVLTNIEMDHPDFFRDVEAVASVFHQLVGKLPADGWLFANVDDPRIRAGFIGQGHQVQTFSLFDRMATLYVEPGKVADQRQAFSLWFKGKNLGRGNLQLPGSYNLANAAGAALAALSLGATPQQVLDALTDFQGTWRRFENLGVRSGAIMVTDYAHHPTAIRQVRAAASAWFPGKRLTIIFQPHHRQRLRGLLAEFATAFEKDDDVIIMEVYAVAGREAEDETTMSSRQLVEALHKREVPAVFARSDHDLTSLLVPKLGDDRVFLFLGAGDIDDSARKFARANV